MLTQSCGALNSSFCQMECPDCTSFSTNGIWPRTTTQRKSSSPIALMGSRTTFGVGVILAELTLIIDALVK